MDQSKVSPDLPKDELINEAAVKAVGMELASVLPKHDKPWFRQKHLLQLNFLIIFLLLTPASLGFDASMMNGLQSLETWRDYFGEPKGAKLGFMNAVMPLGAVSDRKAIASMMHNANVQCLH